MLGEKNEPPYADWQRQSVRRTGEAVLPRDRKVTPSPGHSLRSLGGPTPWSQPPKTLRARREERALPTRTGSASPSAERAKPFCHVTERSRPSPRTLHFVPLGGPTPWSQPPKTLRARREERALPTRTGSASPSAERAEPFCHVTERSRPSPRTLASLVGGTDPVSQPPTEQGDRWGDRPPSHNLRRAPVISTTAGPSSVGSPRPVRADRGKGTRRRQALGKGAG